MVKPAIKPDPPTVFAVGTTGTLASWRFAAADVANAPYGAIVSGATVFVKQPGAHTRSDFLIVEKPTNLQIVSPVLGESRDHRRPDVTRVRIAMSRAESTLGRGRPPDSYAIVQFANA